MTRGSCLCGAVVFEVHGPLRDVIVCHCVECRRWHGHVSASTAAAREHVVLIEGRGLRWIDSPRSDARARRGFCSECGSSLFWAPAGRDTISIAAGTLDDTEGLRVAAHWYVSQAGGYYAAPGDDVPRFERGGDPDGPIVTGAGWQVPGDHRPVPSPARCRREAGR